MTGPTAPTDVVIATHERPDKLRALLSSLERLPDRRLGRVIVVDDSRRPSLDPSSHSSLRIEIVRVPERILVSEARNRGLARVREEFVYVIDDDNVVDEATFAHPLSYLASHPKVGALMPSVLYESRRQLVWVYATPFAPGRWEFQLLGRNRPRDPTFENRLLPTDALPNAAVFRTDELRAIGGWDERFAVSSTADLCQRLKRGGLEVFGDSHAFTYHSVEPPGSRAYWAEHSTDPLRVYHDVHDWYRLLRVLHPEGTGLPVRALWHTAPANVFLLYGFVVRPRAPLARLGYAWLRGMVRGLFDPI